MRIPLASSGLRPKDIQAAKLVLESQNYTMGEKVTEFEESVARYLGTKYFVMVNSGSSANLIIFEALLRPSKNTPKLSLGDGVLVPAVAWPTTIWPLIQLGLEPVFIDVDPNTLSIDLQLAQQKIDTVGNTKPIKAIFPIHPLGYCIDHNLLDSFCKKNNLIQLNDVCESLGSRRGSLHAGTTGLASSFSFYFSHHITTMEGGGVATNDLDLVDDLRAMRSHGWSRDRSDVISWKNKYSSSLTTQGISENQLKFQFVTTGYNLRPMEIQAAIGIEQLKDLDSFVTKRRNIAKHIRNSLIDTAFEVIDGGALEITELEQSHSWMFICIRVNKLMNQEIRKNLDVLLEHFEIESRPALTGNFLDQPVMRQIYGESESTKFQVAQLVSSNYFMVSSHHDLSDEQIDYLGTSLRSISIKLFE
jgi:CDP-6-deoxy-D-xylo-4-hexulose-3-dehydrase